MVNRQLDIREEEVGLLRQGTNITVQNLFGDLPVRSKHLALRYSSLSEIERDFDRVKAVLVGYLLAYPRPVELRMSLKEQNHKAFRCSSLSAGSHLFTIQSTLAILFQAKLVSFMDKAQWRSASIRTSYFSIRAVLSTTPSPLKATQFISIGQFPVRRGHGATVLFDTIDSLFDASSFGISDDGVRPSIENGRQTGRTGKGIDRWPMFLLRIDLKSQNMPLLSTSDEISADALPYVNRITKAIESLISHFLATCGFARPKVTGAGGRYDRTKSKIDSCVRSHPHSPDPELSRGLAEARFLQNWKRVKTARASNENFRYGLGFDKGVGEIRPSSDCFEEDTLFANGQPRTIKSEAVLEHMLAPEEGDFDSTAGLLWTNPSNDQPVRLNPRTGSVLPAATQTNEVHGTGCWAESRKLQPLAGNQQPSFPQTRFVSRSAKTLAGHLKKYVGVAVLQQAEAPIRDTTTDELLGYRRRGQIPAPKTASAVLSHAVTTQALSAATVVRQVDQKFVLIVAPVQENYRGPQMEKLLLILVDQHAADERIRFEELCQDLCARISTNLVKPLIFEVDQADVELLERSQAYFQYWGFKYGVVANSPSVTAGAEHWKVEVNRLPSLIAERCRAEPRLLIELIRREIWSDQARSHSTYVSAVPKTDAWWSQMAHCPEGMVEMLKSRSCRSAIMFNDALDLGQCRRLVENLAQCTFPFQCAHGRPSLTVVAEFSDQENTGDAHCMGPGGENLTLGYGDAWSNWTKRE